MPCTVFCDESSHTSKASDEPCFVLAAVVLPEACLPAFDEQFEAHKGKHGFSGELRWKKIGYSHGRANFTLQQFSYLRRREGTHLFAMIVHKSEYREWNKQGNREVAFYKMYSQLIRYIVKVLDTDCNFVIDERSDRYPRHTEAMESIVNSMLSAADVEGKLLSVRKGDSARFAGIQLADAFAGAVANSRNARLTYSPAHPVRGILSERIAYALGLRSLAADTWPGDVVNIWNFPEECRATKGDSQEVGEPGKLNWFCEAEIDRIREAARNQSVA